MHTYARARAHAHVCRTHAHTHTHTHARTHTHTHTHTHARTHAHTHTHARTHARTHRVVSSDMNFRPLLMLALLLLAFVCFWSFPFITFSVVFPVLVCLLFPFCIYYFRCLYLSLRVVHCRRDETGSRLSC